MKKYIVPTLNYVDLRLEERIAVSSCTGSCTEEEARLYGLVALTIS